MVKGRSDLDKKSPSWKGGTRPPLNTHQTINLWNMLKFYAAKFISIISILTAISDMLKVGMRYGEKEFEMTEEAYESTKKEVAWLYRTLRKMDFKSSAITAKKIKLKLKDSRIADVSLKNLVDELFGRIRDKCLSSTFLYIPLDDYYNNPRDNWEKIIDRFHDTITDIIEMSKCFALERYAAAVFHSVLIVERGVIEFGKFIGVEDHKPGWTATTNKLKNILKKKYDARTQFEKENFAYFEQIDATIEALKTAWRHKISHIEGKLILMTTEFNSEIAEEIMFATRAFMRRLSEKI